MSEFLRPLKPKPLSPQIKVRTEDEIVALRNHRSAVHHSTQNALMITGKMIDKSENAIKESRRKLIELSDVLGLPE